MFPRKVFLFFSSACSYSGACLRTNIVPGTKTVLRTAKKSCVYIEYYCTDGNIVFGCDSDKNSLVIIYMF